MRGKTVRCNTDRVDKEYYMSVPMYFYNFHNFVTLTTDSMLVNGTEFLVTPKIIFKFVTIEHVPKRTYNHISKNLNKVIKLYV